MRANPTSPRRTALSGLALACALLGAGCNLEMRDEYRVKPLEPSPVFADGRSSRPLVPGTVAQGHLKTDEALHAGRAAGQYVTAPPMQVTREFLERGRERYNIYCAPCHNQDGYGRGLVVLRGFPAPPSYHIDRLRRAPVGYIFDVATNGYGVMYGYADRVNVQDRWAIAAYVRALQYSQHAPAADVPPAEASKLPAPPAPAPERPGPLGPTAAPQGHSGAGAQQPAAPQGTGQATHQ